MKSEFEQRPVWQQMGPYRVTSELFIDLVFTSACDCACPWCISRTREYAREDPALWRQGLEYAFRRFDIKSAIILGGEATVDPAFWEKMDAVREVICEHPVEHLILTTNGNRLRDIAFLNRLLTYPIDAFNLSRMHDDQAVNDAVFGARTLTRKEIESLYNRLHASGRTLRLNVNVWHGNLDSVEAMNRFVHTFVGCCDAIKFTPLMRTDMFDTVPSVTCYTSKYAICEGEIATLWDAFAAEHLLLRRAANILGFVNYAEIDAYGQRVILKYAQVEDKYDRDTVIPTLKLYPNGCLSNEWSFRKDIRARLSEDARL